MQFVYLNTRKQLLNRVLELQEEVNDYKGYYGYYKEAYKRVVKEKSDQDDYIRNLEGQLEHEKDAANGYKKAYFKELEEKQELLKPINVTIEQISADVLKMIREKTLQETHKCTKECFEEHIIPAIQHDCNSMNLECKPYNETVNKFLDHWEERLNENYNFIQCLYIKNGKIKVYFKK